MHIDLTNENREKLQKASHQLNRSVSDLANGIIASAGILEIVEIVKFQPTPESSVNSKSHIKTKRRFVVKLKL